MAAGADTFTVTLLLATGQLVTLTSTATVIGPLAPASKMMALVPWPPAMVPFVTVHVYVAPGTEGVLALWPVESLHTVGGAVMGGVVGHPTTPTELVALLLPGFASGVVVLTVAVFDTVVPVAGAVTVMVMGGAGGDAESGPIVHVTVVVPLQVQPVPDALWNVTLAGRVSVTVTSFAAPAPMFVTVRV